MADLAVAAANRVQQWDSQYFLEYVRDSIFVEHTGTDENNVFVTKKNLTKKAGDKITLSVINKLSGAGITGSNTLEGNEEALPNYGHQITVDQLRNAVRIPYMEELVTEMDLREAARDRLKAWSSDKLRADQIVALMSPNIDGKTAYASTAEADKDAWLVANSDRVQCGELVANIVSGDHSVALATIDSTNDKLKPATISLMKRLARTASPAITPLRVRGEEWFILYAGSLPFRDLAVDTTMVQANREARERGKDNPLFRGGDLIWDGVIIREVPEIPVLAGVGNGGIDVGATFLCGARAVGMAWAALPSTTTKTFDYGDKFGVAVKETRGVEKLTFNSKQPIVTGYFSAVADG